MNGPEGSPPLPPSPHRVTTRCCQRTGVRRWSVGVQSDGCLLANATVAPRSSAEVDQHWWHCVLDQACVCVCVRTYDSCLGGVRCTQRRATRRTVRRNAHQSRCIRRRHTHVKVCVCVWLPHRQIFSSTLSGADNGVCVCVCVLEEEEMQITAATLRWC